MTSSGRLFSKAMRVTERYRDGFPWEAWIVDAPYEFTYDDLAQFAEDTGTRDIMVEYQASERDHSELTPGMPSQCLVIAYLRRMEQRR
jgi:hypothetical protein